MGRAGAGGAQLSGQETGEAGRVPVNRVSRARTPDASSLGRGGPGAGEAAVLLCGVEHVCGDREDFLAEVAVTSLCLGGRAAACASGGGGTSVPKETWSENTHCIDAPAPAEASPAGTRRGPTWPRTEWPQTERANIHN